MDYSPVQLLVISIAPLTLWVWSVLWAGRDADGRGKNGALVSVLVAIVGWPGSLLLWVVFRPERIADRSKKPPTPLTDRYSHLA